MKKLLFQRFTKKTISCISALALLLTVICAVPTVATTEIWGGKPADTASVNYAGGSGTEDDPFMIENGDQLYKMVAENYERISDGQKKFFCLANDIYLNDVTKADWKENSPSEWYYNTRSNSYCFSHVFDGAGFTVYGVYITADSSDCTGFIPVMGQNAWVRNVTLSDAHIVARGRVGGFTSFVQEVATSVKFTSCGITNSYLHGSCASSRNDIASAGFVAVSVGKTNIENSYISNTVVKHGKDGDMTGLAGGFVGDTYSGSTAVNASNSYSQGMYPYATRAGRQVNYRNNNVYTTIEATTDFQKAVSGVKYVAENDIKGDAAKENLKNFSFDKFWDANPDNFPTLKKGKGPGYFIMYDEGKPGEAWTGLISEEFGGGTGTENDPYIIATAGQLARLVYQNVNGETFKGVHFKMTENIYLNDVSDPNWKEKYPKPWYTNGGFYHGFRGHLDGDGHIVFGMYVNVPGRNYIYSGLFPMLQRDAVVEKVGVVESEIKFDYEGIKDTFAGAIAGAVAAVDGVEGERPIIRECFSDSTTYFTAASAGGIVGAGGGQITIVDCYSTCGLTVNLANDSWIALAGHNWANPSGTITTSYYASQVKGGVMANPNANRFTYSGNYCLAFQPSAGVIPLYNVNKMRGEAAKTNMPDLDFENVWLTKEGETPMLKAFEANKALIKNTHSFDQIDDIKYINISFATYCDIEVDPLVGQMFEPLELPKLPDRKGYKFAGWYTTTAFNYEFPLDIFPSFDLVLYAKWITSGFEQDFEDYPNTSFDIGEDYELYRMSSENFSTDYVHGGARALHRFGNDANDADFLIKYEEELEVGRNYEMTFWATTDKAACKTKLALVHNTWPDITDEIHSVEKPFSIILKKGEWKQFTVKFTAQTKWVSLRVSGGNSLFFDDFFFTPEATFGTIRPSDKELEELNKPVETPVEDNKTEEPEIEAPDEEPEAEEEPVEEPEEDKKPSTDKKEDKDDAKSDKVEEDNNVLLYVLIGVGAALIIAAAIVLIVLKAKKK